MTRHWADDPTDDLAFTAYRNGFNLAVGHAEAGVKAELPAYHSRPFRDGYADGWIDVELNERNTP